MVCPGRKRTTCTEAKGSVVGGMVTLSLGASGNVVPMVTLSLGASGNIVVRGQWQW